MPLCHMYIQSKDYRHSEKHINIESLHNGTSNAISQFNIANPHFNAVVGTAANSYIPVINRSVLMTIHTYNRSFLPIEC